MPEMGGLTATREIRNSDLARRNIPIIAMTAHAMRGDRERCLEAGMNHYVSKPVSPQALVDAIVQWLPAEKTAAEQSAVTCAPGRSGDAHAVWNRPAVVERLMGDEELVNTIMEAFLGDIPKQIQALRRYLEAGDADGVERQAHTINGASANVGGEALRAVALSVERASKRGDLDAARASMQDLEEAFRSLQRATEYP
jgi:two-component system sensor histidine kinase/response regulator